MPTRWRKLIGGVGMMAFLAAYAVGAAMLFDHLPKQPWIQLVYMAAVGICWGVPLIPLLGWMNRGR
jgi:hypothetical protein